MPDVSSTYTLEQAVGDLAEAKVRIERFQAVFGHFWWNTVGRRADDIDKTLLRARGERNQENGPRGAS